jgi:hypothetical protein
MQHKAVVHTVIVIEFGDRRLKSVNEGAVASTRMPVVIALHLLVTTPSDDHGADDD